MVHIDYSTAVYLKLEHFEHDTAVYEKIPELCAPGPIGGRVTKSSPTQQFPGKTSYTLYKTSRETVGNPVKKPRDPC